MDLKRTILGQLLGIVNVLTETERIRLLKFLGSPEKPTTAQTKSVQNTIERARKRAQR